MTQPTHPQGPSVATTHAAPVSRRLVGGLVGGLVGPVSNGLLWELIFFFTLVPREDAPTENMPLNICCEDSLPSDKFAPDALN